MPDDTDFVRAQLITCIGNKRRLIGVLEAALTRIRSRLGDRKLRVLDAFAGSGVVSRYLKRHAAALTSNDIELFAHLAGECYLANWSGVDIAELKHHHRCVAAAARELPVRDGFIRRLYAPRCDDDIRPGERAFYTVDNAMRIDSLRHAIARTPPHVQPFLLGPLLHQASVHANTAGVFKGFYKDAAGVGRFGGNSRDALRRITGPIELPMPVFSQHECEVRVTRQDANAVIGELPALDLAYLDPPYNQHPYGSNYFMLNLIAQNQEPTDISPVSGIPRGWTRSAYNKRSTALAALSDLVERTPASHLLISYNDEGFISREQFESLLRRHGRHEVIETRYNTFRGSRNLRSRTIHVRERLFLLERP